MVPAFAGFGHSSLARVVLGSLGDVYGSRRLLEMHCHDSHTLTALANSLPDKNESRLHDSRKPPMNKLEPCKILNESD